MIGTVVECDEVLVPTVVMNAARGGEFGKLLEYLDGMVLYSHVLGMELNRHEVWTLRDLDEFLGGKMKVKIEILG